MPPRPTSVFNTSNVVTALGLLIHGTSSQTDEKQREIGLLFASEGIRAVLRKETDGVRDEYREDRADRRATLSGGLNERS